MSKKITVGKSHLVLLVLRKPKRRERSCKMQRTCPQKSPVIISANSVCECFQLKRKINQLRQLKFNIRWNGPPSLFIYEVVSGCHDWIHSPRMLLVGDYTYRSYSVIRPTVFFKKFLISIKNYRQSLGASYRRIFSRNNFFYHSYWYDFKQIKGHSVGHWLL